MWVIILLFILIYYLNSLCLERDAEDVDEVFIVFKCLFIKGFLCLSYHDKQADRMWQPAYVR